MGTRAFGALKNTLFLLFAEVKRKAFGLFDSNRVQQLSYSKLGKGLFLMQKINILNYSEILGKLVFEQKKTNVR